MAIQHAAKDPSTFHTSTVIFGMIVHGCIMDAPHWCPRQERDGQKVKKILSPIFVLNTFGNFI